MQIFLESILVTSLRLCQNHNWFWVDRYVCIMKIVVDAIAHPQVASEKFSNIDHYINKHNVINSKTTARGRWEGGVNLTPLPVVFPNMYLLKKERLKPWKFHLNSSCPSENIKTFSFNISYFHQFSSIFRIIWYFLATKKLMMSTCNKWCQKMGSNRSPLPPEKIPAKSPGLLQLRLKDNSQSWISLIE